MKTDVHSKNIQDASAFRLQPQRAALRLRLQVFYIAVVKLFHEFFHAELDE